jgi:hypothetical protein
MATDGVSPKICRKVRDKWAVSENPASIAAALTESPRIMPRAANCKPAHCLYPRKVCPVVALKYRNARVRSIFRRLPSSTCVIRSIGSVAISQTISAIAGGHADEPCAMRARNSCCACKSRSTASDAILASPPSSTCAKDGPSDRACPSRKSTSAPPSAQVTVCSIPERMSSMSPLIHSPADTIVTGPRRPASTQVTALAWTARCLTSTGNTALGNGTNGSGITLIVDGTFVQRKRPKRTL